MVDRLIHQERAVVRLKHFGVVFCLLGLFCGAAIAAEPSVAESRDFETARAALEDRQFDFAERQFAEFAAKHPESTLLPAARLRQAEAMQGQRKFDEALALLRDNLPRAGVLADQFAFTIGENLFAKGDWAAAETNFNALIAAHPDSAQVPAAAVRLAGTFAQRKNFEKATALLADPAGAFERARTKAPVSAPAIDGVLLLAEVRIELGRFADAEAALALLPNENLSSLAAWRQTALRSRVLTATDRALAAQGLSAELMKLAASTQQPELVAESHALNGAILEKLGRKTEALAAYEPNLKPAVPVRWRSQALVRVVSLALETGGATDAVQRLELLSAQGLDDAARDLVQVTLGELRLRLFLGLPLEERAEPARFSFGASNQLFGALAHFETVITSYTTSPYLGKAWLNRGWCLWELRQWPLAAESFGEASRKLEPGLDLARAVFKLGDAQYQLRQFAAALTNYARLIQEFGQLAAVKEGLLDQAYYQIIQAAIQTGNQEEAERALRSLLAEFPGNFHAERGLLLVGQFLNEIREPARSRAVLEEFAKRFQNSALAPERELAIARTYELEGNWLGAVATYDQWLSQHTNHTALATAEFQRAHALSQARQATNALTSFTNFVARFPTNALTPKALAWLGKHYDSTQDFPEAERHYQQLFSGPHWTNWPVTRLTYEARVDASRSAFNRRGYGDARYYLTNLLNVITCASDDVDLGGTNCCPRDIYAGALFAYGDVLTSEPGTDASRFDTARTAFQRLVDRFPENALVPGALGRIGECNLQLRLYAEATNAYALCLRHPLASVTERSQAEVGIGQVLEKQAAGLAVADQAPLLMAARDHYLNVLYKVRDPADVADSFWLQQACNFAAKLAEGRGDWAGAAALYRRLKELLPVLSDYLDPLIRQLEEKGSGGNGRSAGQ